MTVPSIVLCSLSAHHTDWSPLVAAPGRCGAASRSRGQHYGDACLQACSGEAAVRSIPVTGAPDTHLCKTQVP